MDTPTYSAHQQDAQRAAPSPAARLVSAWQALGAPRQQQLGAGAALCTLALLWFAVLQPAWHTHRQAQHTLPLLQAQLRHMQNLQQQAAQAREIAPLDPVQAQTLFAQACRSYGIPETPLQHDAPTRVELQQLSAQDLAHWLEAVRTSARVLPVQLHLRRDAQGLWSGSVVVQGR